MAWPWARSAPRERVEPTIGAARALGDDADIFWRDSLWSVPSATGVRINQQTALAATAVMACARVIAEDIGKLGIEIYRKRPDGSRDPATDHQLYVLLRRPNDWQTWIEFGSQMTMALVLRGNAYAILVRDGRARVTMMVPINPDQVQLYEAPDGALFYMVTRIGLHQLAVLRDEPLMIPADDVLHLKGLSTNGLLGFSPIAVAREAIGLAVGQQEQAARLMGNGGRPSGVLTTDGKLTPDAAKRMGQEWRDIHAGLQNTGRVAVLEQGLKFQPLTLTSVDMEFLAQRQFQVLEICRIFRVPPHMVGELGKVNNATIVQQAQEYANYTLSTYTTIWRQRLAKTFDLTDIRLAQAFGVSSGLEVDFDMSVLLEGDIVTRFTTYRLGSAASLLTPNEMRKREKLNPDPSPEADKLWRPVNMAPIDSAMFEATEAGSADPAGIGSDMGGENPGAGAPGDGLPDPDQAPAA